PLVFIWCLTDERNTLVASSTNCRYLNPLETVYIMDPMAADIATFPAVFTIIVFLFSTVLVIRPIAIPLPLCKRAKIHLNTATAPLFAVLVLLCSRCISPALVGAALTNIDSIKPYNVLLLFFSLAYLAITLDMTGVLQAAAFYVSNKGGRSGRRLFLYFYLLETALSSLLGNDAVVLSAIPFLVYYTRATELSSIPWLCSGFTVANTASMVLFVGNITNVVLCEGLNIGFVVYTAYIIFPFLACSVFGYVALYTQFRKVKQIPQRILAPNLDPGSVLLDPFGAWVGSITMALCLATILGTSFAAVDVWEIALPFALAKLVFDLIRDLQHTSAGTIQESHQTTNEKEMKKALEEGSIMLPCEGRTGTCVFKVGQFSCVSSSTRDPTPANQEQIIGHRYLRILFRLHEILRHRLPTVMTALPRLPLALLPFTLSQFVLVQALSHTGWISIFALWLSHLVGQSPMASIWVIGIFTNILCNFCGTNIGTTVLMIQVIKHPIFISKSGGSDAVVKGAGLAIAVASNIGAVSVTWSASLAGLLYRSLLRMKNVQVTNFEFAKWNIFPLFAMSVAGFGVICAEVKILYS
ncbi:Arsenical pump membrane protein, partial [Neolecta irregularis DAH-3]